MQALPSRTDAWCLAVDASSLSLQSGLHWRQPCRQPTRVWLPSASLELCTDTTLVTEPSPTWSSAGVCDVKTHIWYTEYSFIFICHVKLNKIFDLDSVFVIFLPHFVVNIYIFYWFEHFTSEVAAHCCLWQGSDLQGQWSGHRCWQQASGDHQTTGQGHVSSW